MPQTPTSAPITLSIVAAVCNTK